MTSRRSTPLGATAIRQANLREHNLGLVLRLIIDATIPPSRADIAVATGLTRATVSSLADRLIMAGLVTELPPLMSQRAGRPAVPLVAATGTIAAVGMEINVDYLGVRVVDLSGAVLGQHVESTDFRGSDPEAVMQRLSQLYLKVTGELDEHLRMAGSALAIPGLVDRALGPVRLAPNLGWRDTDVVELFHSHRGTSQVRIRLDNEATLGARAEADALRPSGALSFLYLSGEVGIGGALVIDGVVFGGRHGWSGEIGHTVVDPAGPLCRCGATGCLEQFAGKDALMRGAGMALDLPVDDLVQAADDGNGAALQSISIRRGCARHRAGQCGEPDRRRDRRARRYLRSARAVPDPGDRHGTAGAGVVGAVVGLGGPAGGGPRLRGPDRRRLRRALGRHRRPERLARPVSRHQRRRRRGRSRILGSTGSIVRRRTTPCHTPAE